ncbi:unnamed protein product [Closterium sp. Yama58-4]|nr:unnamed protein product [Closterium sp. Yama58-4]
MRAGTEQGEQWRKEIYKYRDTGADSEGDSTGSFLKPSLKPASVPAVSVSGVSGAGASVRTRTSSFQPSCSSAAMRRLWSLHRAVETTIDDPALEAAGVLEAGGVSGSVRGVGIGGGSSAPRVGSDGRMYRLHNGRLERVGADKKISPEGVRAAREKVRRDLMWEAEHVAAGAAGRAAGGAAGRAAGGPAGRAAGGAAGTSEAAGAAEVPARCARVISVLEAAQLLAEQRTQIREYEENIMASAACASSNLKNALDLTPSPDDEGAWVQDDSADEFEDDDARLFAALLIALLCTAPIAPCVAASGCPQLEQVHVRAGGHGSAAPGCCGDAATPCGIAVQNGRAGAPRGGCLLVENQAVHVSNASFTGCSAGSYGGAIAALNAPRVTLSRVHVSGSSVSSLSGGGGGVALQNVTIASVTECWFEECTAKAGIGGGVYCEASRVEVQGGGFSRCAADSNGGGLATKGCSGSIDGVSFSENKATIGGCMADTSSPALAVSRCSFLACVATNPLIDLYTHYMRGAAIHANDTASLSVSLSSFLNGSSSMGGAGIMALGVGNLTVTTCEFRGNHATAPNGGGGAAIEGQDSNVTVLNSSFFNNTAESPMMAFGGAVYLIDCPSLISNCSFVGNRGVHTTDGATSQGGALLHAWGMIKEPVLMEVEDCVFEGNTARFGGAASFESHAVLRRTRFLRNNASFRLAGAAMFMREGTIEDCEFRDNTVLHSGGAIATGGVGLTSITRTTFINNTALSAEGGAIMVQAGTTGSIFVADSLFLNNSALLSKGGAIFFAGDILTIDNSTFVNNSALVKGGAISVEGSSSSSAANGTLYPVSVSHSHFLSNRADLGGGAISLSSQASVNAVNCSLLHCRSGSGGAVLIEDFGRLRLHRSECAWNQAPSGGGCISLGDFSSATVTSSNVTCNDGGNEGGALRMTGQTVLSLSASLLSNNSALDGGALWAEMNAQVEISGSNLTGNTAKVQGGGVYAIHKSNLTVSDSRFVGNRALLGGGLLAEGEVAVSVTGETGFEQNEQHGVVLMGQTKARFQDTGFRGNRAGGSRDGGAVLVSDVAVVVLVGGVVMERNWARRGGAVFADADSSLTLSDALLGAAAAGGAVGGAAGVGAAGGVKRAAGEGAGAGSSSLQARRPRLIRNRAEEQGAGVFAGGNATITITGAAFTNNKAGGSGAGIAILEQAHGTLTGCGFRRNVGGGEGAGVYINRGGAGGGRRGKWGLDRWLWEGSGERDAGGEAHYRVRGDMANPVAGLHVTLLDAAGLVASSDDSVLVEVVPNPYISGELRATAVGGTVTVPPITIVQHLHFSFRPGATSPSDCLPCSNTTADRTNLPAMTCADGVADVAAGYWLDPGSVENGEVVVYSCDVLYGCPGFQVSTLENETNTSLYPSLDLGSGQGGGVAAVVCSKAEGGGEGNGQGEGEQGRCGAVGGDVGEYGQCGEGYAQVRLCSECASSFYALLRECHACTATLTNLFPLFLTLIILAWAAMALLSSAFHAAATFLTDLQLLALIASYSVPLPTWLNPFIQVFQLSLFIPVSG